MVDLNRIKLFLHKINKYQIKSQENSNSIIYGQKLKLYYKQLGGSLPDLTDKQLDELIAFQDEIPSMPVDKKKRNIQLLKGLKDVKVQEDRNKYYKEHLDCLNNNFDKEFKLNEENYDKCENNLIKVIEEYLKTQQK